MALTGSETAYFSISLSLNCPVDFRGASLFSAIAWVAQDEKNPRDTTENKTLMKNCIKDRWIEKILPVLKAMFFGS
jgi:hypothetical protein